MVTIENNGAVNGSIFLTNAEKRKIQIGAQTNLGAIKAITTYGHWLINGEIVGEWRDVIEIDGKYYIN